MLVLCLKEALNFSSVFWLSFGDFSDVREFLQLVTIIIFNEKCLLKSA